MRRNFLSAQGSIDHATNTINPDNTQPALKDRVVLDAVIDGNERLTIRLAEGTVLVVSASSEGLVVRLGQAGEKDAAARPTHQAAT